MTFSSRYWQVIALSAAITFVYGCSSKQICSDTSQTTESKIIESVQERVMPSLVRIYVVSSEMQNGREHKLEGAGSGAIISKDGYVVTNHHVVGHAKKIWCTLSNRERVEAELIGTDALTDIAVIKLLPQTMRNPITEFSFVNWGDSSKVKAGDRVFALGSPGALAQSITSGIVSNPEIVIPNGQLELDGEAVGTMVRWIFHDAQIYHGNSGGPLVNIKGEIIGINEMGTASLGGAIPSNVAQHTVSELLKNKGVVPRSWTGLNLQKLLFTDTDDVGALVSWIDRDSPAEKAGIKSGDKLIAVNDQAIHLRYDEEFPELNRRLLNTKPGSTIKLTIKRGKEVLTKELVTETRGNLLGKQEEMLSLGITASDLTRFTGLDYKLKPNEGVLITGIREGYPIEQAKPKLFTGDIIKKINNMPVRNIKELNKIVADINAKNTNPDKPTEVVITAQHGLDEILTVIPLSIIQDPKTTPTSRKAWFPGNVQILTIPLAEKLNLSGVHGVRITRVLPQLEKSGLKVGDIVTKVNDLEIDAYDQAHTNIFPNIITTCSTSKPTLFTIIRDKKESVISFKLPRSPKPAAELPSYKNDFLGLKVRTTTEIDKINNDIKLEETNLIVDKVESGGWAHLGKLRVGDIILKINGQEVKNLKQYQEVLEKNIKEKSESIIFLVKRNYAQGFVEVRPNWSK